MTAPLRGAEASNSLFDDIREALTALYICAHSRHGLMTFEPCEKGCNGQVAMFREDELRKAIDDLRLPRGV